ncbi:MAG TPA: PTS sugar transporter subunit IIA, partial [Beijerinckiaceae bacterium]
MVIDDCFDLQVKNKKELFAALASRAAERLALAPEAALRALDNREKLGSTALGQGVALPHAQMSEASGP